METSASQLAFLEHLLKKKISLYAESCLDPTDVTKHLHPVLIQMALDRGLLSKRDQNTLTAKGWSVATSVLKR